MAAEEEVPWTSTLLHAASRQGDHQEATSLLKNGTDVEAQDLFGNTALHNASKYSYESGRPHAAVVQLLLKKGANTDAQNFQGETALHLSSRDGGEIKVTQLLLEAGAYINAPGYFARTALHYACERGRQAIVELLLKKGANKDIQDEFGLTPLHVASSYGRHTLVQILLKNGANTDIRDQKESTALHAASGPAAPPTCTNGFPAIVELLLKKSADINARDAAGYTPLDLTKLPGNKKNMAQIIKLLEGATLKAWFQTGSTSVVAAFVESAAGLDGGPPLPILDWPLPEVVRSMPSAVAAEVFEWVARYTAGVRSMPIFLRKRGTANIRARRTILSFLVFPSTVVRKMVRDLVPLLQARVEGDKARKEARREKKGASSAVSSSAAPAVSVEESQEKGASDQKAPSSIAKIQNHPENETPKKGE
jgi:ankyrin repeat protein